MKRCIDMNAAEAEQTEIRADSADKVYPQPPPWFTFYRPDADGSAERPLPPHPPELPSDEYESFGRLESVETGIPSLAVKQLFNLRQDGTVDFKGELGALNQELILQYLQFASTLVDRPSAYGRDIEAISTILRNMHFLLNCLRVHQARASLGHILQNEVKDRLDAIADLRHKRENAEKVLAKYAEKEDCKDYAQRLQD